MQLIKVELIVCDVGTRFLRASNTQQSPQLVSLGSTTAIVLGELTSFPRQLEWVD